MSVRSQPAGKESRHKERRAGRMLLVFKALVLLTILGATAYGTYNNGLYDSDEWLPVAAGTLAVWFITLFVRNFFTDVPPVLWVVVGFLASLVAIKGLSMLWTLSDDQTILELLRSSMYLAAFVMVLAAVSSERQVAPLMDAAILIASIVAGYGLLQKLKPVEYPVVSIDGVRVDSSLNYANTAGMMLGMGVILVLSRMSSLRNPLVRGLFAALALAFIVTLYLTGSRGGIFSFGIGLGVLIVLTLDRLQTLANLLLVLIPTAAIIWAMQGLGGLLEAGATEKERVADGATFGVYLILALVAAFVLQAVFAFLRSRYELTTLSRRILGAIAVAVAVLAVVTGVLLTTSRYGGLAKAYETLVSNPAQTQNVGQRLASLSLGYRVDYWKAGWGAWKEHPLTGTGAGTFQFTWLTERTEDTGVKQVHNLYLEQGTETGIFAFLALVVFCALLLGYTVRATWRSGRSGERRVLLSGLVATMVVYLISSGIEWHWYIPPSTLYFFILAATAAKLASRPDWLAPAENPAISPNATEG